MISDFLNLILLSVRLLFVREPQQFGVTLLVGVLLAILCWFGCSRYSRLWNLRYRVTFTHHLLCLIAALLTLAFSVTWKALRHTKEAAELSIENWEGEINRDKAWTDSTFKKAWLNVRALGLEDFSEQEIAAGHTIPVTKDQSKIAATSTYSNESLTHFRHHRAFLSLVLKARAEVSSDLMKADVKAYFASRKGSYPVNRGITLVAKQVKSELSILVPRVVPVCQWTAVVLFILVQCVPFGLVGLAAYHDIKSSV